MKDKYSMYYRVLMLLGGDTYIHLPDYHSTAASAWAQAEKEQVKNSLIQYAVGMYNPLTSDNHAPPVAIYRNRKQFEVQP